MTGRFISTHSVALVLPMRISRIPARGNSVHADASSSRPGGGFTTLSVAASLGVPTALASPLGTGPNAYTVRQQLLDAGVEVLTQELVGDIGVVIQLIEEDGIMTSVVTAGVESEPSRVVLDSLVLRPGDLIHIAASDLTSPHSAKVLAGWGAALPPSVTLVVSVSPAVEQVPVEAWKLLLGRADIVTMNVRQSAALSAILAQNEAGVGVRHLMRPEAALVRRMGAHGCELQRHVDDPMREIPAYDADIADTAGVGDTHIAVMCAGLLKGMELADACQMANAASAIAISHESALPVPTQEEIERVMETGTSRGLR
ncbi:carbohydrate kinase [Schaalia sp. ZJ405]|uniref:PfkB family carbohydrate kinase n=1 Tax=unclassified Schaalia TaxID=2691889 RepID=UPI0018CBDCDE|nr:MULTISPECIES: PfkB family carbohydrate kinase [unclassified Schaalia]QPK81838.1 carbohydrate kinase [Schaalia sp. ZJ405]